MFGSVDITLGFEFGEIDGRSMTADIVCGDQTVKVNKDSPIAVLKKVNLPTRIELSFDGKRSGDTIVSESGEIIKDVYIRINEFRIDSLRMSEWTLYKKLSYITEDGETKESGYVGWNGHMVIDIPENNVFAFYKNFHSDS